MTVRHVVSWQLASPDEQERAERAQQIRDRLLALRDVVPGIRALEVGVNDVADERNWQLVLIADYDDEDALRAYAEHPAHLEVAGFIRSVTSARSAVDFHVDR